MFCLANTSLISDEMNFSDLAQVNSHFPDPSCIAQTLKQRLYHLLTRSLMTADDKAMYFTVKSMLYRLATDRF